MSTQLALQLASLAASAGIDKTKRPKGQPSLLYDAHVAADIAAEQIHAQAIKGFEALCKVDARFVPYKKSLLSRSSLEYVRSQQTKEVNAKVDSSLASFCQLLVPHFLTAPATAVLEYLIRQYKIHVHNVEQLLAALIPFHACAEFSKLVQLCNLDGTVWVFLKRMQETGATLPRSALVKFCAKQQAVIQVICESVRSCHAAKAVTRTTTSFYAALVCEVLQAAEPSQALLQALLPHLEAGLHANALPNYRAATYMIAAVAASATTLSTPLLESLIDEICKSMAPSQLQEVLMLLGHLFKSQRSLRAVPPNALKHLIKQAALPAELSVLQADGLDVSALVHALLMSVAPVAATVDRSATFLASFVTDVQIPHAAAEAVAALLASAFSSAHDASKDEQPRENGLAEAASSKVDLSLAGPVLRAFEARYPDALDAGIRDALEACNDGVLRGELLEALQAALSGSVRAPVGGDSSLTLALAVTSASAALRAEALTALSTLASAPDAQADTVAFAHDALLERLTDSSEAVVLAALDAPALLTAPQARLCDAALACMQAVNARLHASAGDRAPAWTASAARGIARKLLKIIMQLVHRDSAPESFRDRVVPLLLPLSLPLAGNRKLAAAAIRALSHLPPSFVLAAIFAKVDLLQPSKSDLEGDKQGAKKGRATRRRSAEKNNNSNHTNGKAAAPTPAGPELDHRNACTVQQTLADALISDAAARSALLTLFERTSVRGRHILLLAIGAALHHEAAGENDEASSECTRVVVEALVSWGRQKDVGEGVVQALPVQEAAVALDTGALAQQHLEALERDPPLAYATVLRDVAHIALTKAAPDLLPHARRVAVLHTLCALPAPSAFEAHISSLYATAVMGQGASGAMQMLCDAFGVSDERASQNDVRPRVLGLLASSAEDTRALAYGADALSDTVPFLMAAVVSKSTAVRQAAAAAAAALAGVMHSGAKELSGFLGVLGANRRVLEESPAALLSLMHNSLGGNLTSPKKDRQQGFALTQKQANTLTDFLVRWLGTVQLTSAGLNAAVVTMACLAKHIDHTQALRASSHLLQQIVSDPSGLIAARAHPSDLRAVCRSVLHTMLPEAVATLASEAPDQLQGYVSALDAHPAAKSDRVAEHKPHILSASSDLMTCVRLDAIRQTSAEMWQALPDTLQRRVVVSLLLSAASDPSPLCRTAAHDALDKLPIAASHLLPPLQALSQCEQPETTAANASVKRSNAGRKRTRKSRDAASSPVGDVTEAVSELSAALPEAMPVLELLQWKDDVDEGAAMLDPLQSCMRVCMAGSRPAAPPVDDEDGEASTSAAEGADLASSCLYALGLSVSALSRLVARLDGSNLGGVDVDDVLRAAEVSTSGSIQAAALDLLSTLAAAAPQLALDSVLRIVSFAAAGGGVLPRASGAAADSIVLRAVRSVTSAWARSQQDVETLWSTLLDALPEAPAARRVPLLSAVLASVDSELGLVSLTRSVCARVSGLSSQKDKDSETSDMLMAVLADVYREQDSALRMGALATVLKTAEDGDAQAVAAPLARLLVRFCGAQLRLFVSEAGTAAPSDCIGPAFQSILEAVFTQLRLLLRLDATTLGVDAARDGLQDLLTALRAVVDKPSLLQALTAVLQETQSDGVQRLALRVLQSTCDSIPAELEILETRPEDERRVKAEALVSAARAVVPVCLALCHGDATAESATVRHAAVLVVDAIAAALGGGAEPALSAAVPTLVAMATSEAEDSVAVKTSAIAALGRVIDALGVQAVPFVPQIVAVFLSSASMALASVHGRASGKQAAEAVSEAALDVLLLSAALAALSIFVKVLPGFSSPYLQNILKLLLDDRVLALPVATCRAAAASMLAQLPLQLPPRLLLPALREALPDAQLAGPKPFVTLLGLLSDLVRALTSAAALEHADAVFTLLMQALDCATQDALVADKGANAETVAVDAFVAAVLKLSESRFKPLFLRMVEWSESVPSHVAELDDPAAKQRGLLCRQSTFFACVCAVSKALRSVFTPYFQHVLDSLLATLQEDSPAVLPASSKPSKKRRKSRASVVPETKSAPEPASAGDLAVARLRATQCVHRACMYDTQGFVTPERFERMLAAVLAQLQRKDVLDVTATEKQLQAQASRHPDLLDTIELGAKTELPVAARAAVAALTQLALAANSDALWKRLNHEVLMLTRSEDAALRLAALEVVHNVVSRLREEYLVLLPESLPFLSELLEDGEAQVAARNRDLIKVLETLAEEDLTQYLRP